MLYNIGLYTLKGIGKKLKDKSVFQQRDTKTTETGTWYRLTAHG
jgi:hypothetical protein